MSTTKYTVKFPLELDTTSYNNYESVGPEELYELVNFNIKNVLLTNPGERTWDTDFGVGLNRILFEQFDELELDLIESQIRAQIDQYVPYVYANEIRLSTSPNRSTLGVKIIYTIAQVGTSHELDVEVGEEEEGSAPSNADTIVDAVAAVSNFQLPSMDGAYRNR